MLLHTPMGHDKNKEKIAETLKKAKPEFLDGEERKSSF